MDTNHRSDLEAQLMRMGSIEGHLEDLALRASFHLGPGFECSIILRHRGEDRRVASSTESAGRCDDAENASGEGPCLTAMDDLRTVLVPDVHAESRWPAWRAQVVASGFRSGAAFPDDVGEDADIAFNVYSDRLDPWSTERVLHADAYAQQVGTVLALCLQVARLTHEHDEHLSAARARQVIDQAVGALVVRQEIDAGEALELLRDHAADRGIEILEAATAILAGGVGEVRRDRG